MAGRGATPTGALAAAVVGLRMISSTSVNDISFWLHRTGYWTQPFCDPTMTGTPSWRVEPVRDVNSFDYHLSPAVPRVFTASGEDPTLNNFDYRLSTSEI